MDANSATSLEVHQRLENIRLILHTFKVEQEQLILKFNDEYKFRLNRPSTLMNPAGKEDYSNPQTKVNQFLQPPNHSSTHGHQNQALGEIHTTDTAMLVSKLLNVETVIMPVGNDLFSNQKLWPQALLAHYRDEIGKVGSIESHGSLWKLIPRKDNMSGQRVILQAAEIGEEPKYLNARLELVDLKADAAIWNLKMHDLPAENEMNYFRSNDSTKGIPVIFELVGGIQTENTINPELVDMPKEGSMLVCSFSRLSSTSELLLLSKQDLKALEASDEYQGYSFIWEICPENWINDDLEFLDRYLA